MKLAKITQNLTETAQLAKWLAAKLNPGDIVALSGPLGSGKTTFIKAFAKALGVRAEVTSPTFLILKVYPVHRGRIKKIVHVDLYRLEHLSDLREVGFYQYLSQPDTILVIEWAEKIKKILPPQTVWINIKMPALGPGRRSERREFEIVG